MAELGQVIALEEKPVACTRSNSDRTTCAAAGSWCDAPPYGCARASYVRSDVNAVLEMSSGFRISSAISSQTSVISAVDEALVLFSDDRWR